MGSIGKSPTGVLLVGSIPLSTPEEVFTTIPPTLAPGKLHSLPDGEPGERDTYIWWQRERFPAESRRFNPVCAGTELPADHPGFTNDSIPPTGYGDAAVSSWNTFGQMQKEGKIPEGLRFQVSLPMPQDCIQFYLRDELQDVLGPVYEQRMKESVTQITETVPAEKLAIQWDIAVLPTAMEYEKGRAGRLPAELFQIPFKPLKEGFVNRLVPFCNMVPAGASLGLHICYGDFEHTHHIQPEDTGVLVDIANSFVKAVGRPINWIHMPVPKDRDDDAYFAPLKNLDIGDTKLYLGLLHAHDEEGTKRRIAQAQKVVSGFGVATECGMGRYTVDEMHNLLQISDSVTA
ncbi:hypothetical protein AJ79_01190 [Helicocarpus griseus UAMH5409]|uniref:Cobalamin-independent methionine synthase MetE C-terminal/archaeal domain-containing protein n=1 Tax=Helicocarpus griseus UAMH5409 TaxID=1447875 RepID=A0A2B7Y718_9EURO|nr:hypothetical protein AJ79_01190 [Helicocarpus griseus UAMH5409]